MRKMLLPFGLIVAVLIAFTTNFSCKKSNQNYLQTILTDGHWQLASLTVQQTRNDSTITNDTINANCNLTQTFTFNNNGMCTFTNFDCIPQTVTGHWAFSSNQLYLSSDVKFQNTTAILDLTPVPFSNAQILNLGQYSLVLQTGDLGTYYPPGKLLTVFKYGFIRVKSQ